jgi:hypothetical protein
MKQSYHSNTSDANPLLSSPKPFTEYEYYKFEYFLEQARSVHAACLYVNHVGRQVFLKKGYDFFIDSVLTDFIPCYS